MAIVFWSSPTKRETWFARPQCFFHSLFDSLFDSRHRNPAKDFASSLLLFVLADACRSRSNFAGVRANSFTLYFYRIMSRIVT